MANSKPTHRIVYTTYKSESTDGEKKEKNTVVGAAWYTNGEAMFLDFSVPTTIMPGDRNIKILPIREKD